MFCLISLMFFIMDQIQSYEWNRNEHPERIAKMAFLSPP